MQTNTTSRPKHLMQA